MSLRMMARLGKLASPTSARFSQQKWERAIGTSKDDDDVLVLRCATWISKRLAGVREMAKDNSLSSLSRLDQVRALVSVANSLGASTGGAIWSKFRSFGDGPVLSNEVQEMTIRVGANEVGPQDLIEAILEGIRFPLAGALGDELLAGDELGKDVGRRANNQVLLGNMYSTFEDAWAQIVWDYWDVEECDTVDRIFPTSQSRENERVIAAHRRQSLEMELSQNAMLGFRFKGGAQRFPSAVPAITELRRKKGRIEMVVGSLSVSPSVPPPGYLHRFFSAEPELAPYKTFRLPRTPSLTVADLENARDLLLTLEAVLPRPNAKVLDTRQELFASAPTLSARQCRLAFVKALKFNLQQATDALEYFVWDGNVSVDPWVAPLVRVGDDDLVPILPAFLSGHPVFTFEYWLKRGGLDAALRGHAFENAMRESLGAVARATGNANVGVLPHCLVVPGRAEVGDIDIVLWFGNCVLLLEAKCNFRPGRAIGYADVWSDYQEAAKQVGRKSAAAEAEREAVLESLKPFGFNGTRDFRVARAILTNLQLGVGSDLGGVPVVDRQIVSAFIRGKLAGPTIMTEAGPDQRHASSVPLYTTMEEAGAMLESYLRRPPQIFARGLQVTPSPQIAQLEDEAEFKPVVFEYGRAESGPIAVPPAFERRARRK